VLSDTAGIPSAFDEVSIEAITDYIKNGNAKCILATYAAFYYKSPGGRVYSNKALMPLFGLNPNIDYSIFNNHAQIVYHAQPGYDDSLLFNDIIMPYHSFGYECSMVPEAKKKWDSSAFLDGADVRICAMSEDRSCAMLHCVAPTHNAFYISSMPEYSRNPGARKDLRLIRNVFKFLYAQNKVRSLTSLCIDCIAKSQPLVDVSDLPEELQDRVLSAHVLRKDVDFERRFDCVKIR
jgi:hypothetical protein